jgi:hypothetical protein
VLVVVGSRFDEEAARLVARWADEGAALLTCEDLSTPGWRHFTRDPRSSTAVVSGAVISTSSIRGVVTRRPSIFPVELAHVAAVDREYVAAEMNAFLLSWLSDLACPVFNPPVPGCLSGPNWSAPQWVRAVARSGIRVRPYRVEIPPGSDPHFDQSSLGEAEPVGETIEVTLVDERCFGAPDEEVASAARDLARSAGVRLLSVRFEMGGRPPVFLGAHPFPSLTQDEIADAVREALLSGKAPAPCRYAETR